MDLALKCLFCGEDLKEGWVSCPGCGNKVVNLNDAVAQGTATVSSNEKFIAVISGDEIHVRNTESMELVDSFSRSYEREVVNAMQKMASPFGAVLVAGAAGRPIKGEWHIVLAISNDGCHLVVSSGKKKGMGEIDVLDVKTKQKIEMYLENGTTDWVSINPDENSSITRKDGEIIFWKREQ